MKFKVGDKVKVKASCKAEGGIYASQEGYIRSVLKGGYHSWPYGVDFVNGVGEHFSARELEKVKE